MRNTVLGTVLTRLRHRRGHGVHSPMVYSMVRGVFMKRPAGSGELFEALRAAGMIRSRAGKMQALYDFVGFEGYSLLECENIMSESVRRNHLLFIDAGTCRSEACELLENIRPSARVAVCIVGDARERRRIVGSTSHALVIERRGYTLLFYDIGLSTQYFIL